MNKELQKYMKKDVKRVSNNLKKLLVSSDDREFLEWACFHHNTNVAEVVLCSNRNIPPSFIEDIILHGPRMTNLFLTRCPKMNYESDTLHRNISRVYGYRVERLFRYNFSLIPVSTLIKSSYIKDFVNWTRNWSLKLYVGDNNYLPSYIMLPMSNSTKSDKSAFKPRHRRHRRLAWFK